MIRLYRNDQVVGLSKYYAFTGGGGALNFQFGKGVQPEGPNRGACERTTADCLGPKWTEFLNKI